MPHRVDPIDDAPILSGLGLSKHFGGLHAVQEVTLHLYSGEILGLVGPNGAGKSTLFDLLTGYQRPTHGDVSWRGESLSGLSPHEVARLGLARTFQHGTVFGHLTVLENVLVGTHATVLPRRASYLSALLHAPSYRERVGAATKAARDSLAAVGLSAAEHTLADNLPMGERRLLGIAMAMARRPRALLLDEPAAGLNESESDRLVQCLRDLRRDGLTILIVEHDMRVIMRLCDRLIVVAQGRKIFEGSPKAAQTDAQVLSAYLGDAEAIA